MVRLWASVAAAAAAAALVQPLWPRRGPSAVMGVVAALIVLQRLALAFGPDIATLDAAAAGAEAAALRTEVLIAGEGPAGFEARVRQFLPELLAEHRQLLQRAVATGARASFLTAFGALIVWGSLAAAATCGLWLLCVPTETAMSDAPRLLLGVGALWYAVTAAAAALQALAEMRMAAPAMRQAAAAAIYSSTAVAGHPRPPPPPLSGTATGRTSTGGGGGGWTTDGPEPDDGLRVTDAWFAYPERTAFALQETSFHAPAGTIVAVVGRSGSGKSTLLSILLGFARPDRGEASLQGRPLPEWDAEAFAERIAWLTQRPARFPTTAGRNIGAGDALSVSAAGSDNAWARAAAAVGAAQIVGQLPRGLETVIEDAPPWASSHSGSSSGGHTRRSSKHRNGGGGDDDGGDGAADSGPSASGLSEGEWARLALARFALRVGDATLCVLDEPFACVDADAAAAVLAVLRHGARERRQVVVVATQKLAIGRAADLVVFMEGGRAVEAGSYEELLARGGQYAAALDRQMTAEGSLN
ncbi:unnamed protein product [Phaeothamnion confervicola]